MISDLPNGLEDNAIIAAAAWEIVNYTYLRTAYFSERPSDEVMVKLTNEFVSARQIIYYSKPLPVVVRE